MCGLLVEFELSWKKRSEHGEWRYMMGKIPRVLLQQTVVCAELNSIGLTTLLPVLSPFASNGSMRLRLLRWHIRHATVMNGMNFDLSIKFYPALASTSLHLLAKSKTCSSLLSSLNPLSASSKLYK